jgi:Do/DeqQ family serine protease
MIETTRSLVSLYAAVAAALVAAVACPNPGTAGVPVAIGANPDEVPTLAPLVAKIAPAVVNVEVTVHVEPLSRPLEDIVAPDLSADASIPRNRNSSAPRQRNAASGIVFDAHEGLILTNDHVIEHADRITVTLTDGRKLKAARVGADPQTDIALIKVQAENLTALPLGDSDKLRVGDFVVAVGNPFAVGQTVTSGIVSALHRSIDIEEYEDFVQSDAATNPGNSGGALVNLRGELVAMNSAIYDATGADVGIGFAIPINMIRAIAEQLLKYGEVRRGNLGIVANDLTPEQVRERKLIPHQTGAAIAAISPGSAAEAAGLRVGDVITAIETAPVHRAADLRNKLWQLGVGDAVDLAVLRDGATIPVHVVLSGTQSVAGTGSGTAAVPTGQSGP